MKSHRKAERRKSAPAVIRSPRSEASSATSSSARSRWSNAIRDVLKQQEERRPDLQQEEETDLVGEHMAELFNASPEFSRRSIVPTQEGQDLRWFRGPLFSSRNLQRWKQGWKDMDWTPQTLVGNTWGFCRSAFCFVTKSRRRLLYGLRAFVIVLALSLALVVSVCQRLIVWLVRTTSDTVSFVLSLLVDPDDLKTLCPSSLDRLWQNIVSVFELVDCTILLGYFVYGRDWERDAHVRRGTMYCPSRRESLSTCPPPYPILLGRRKCMDKEEITKNELWSGMTADHVLAINFCYIMLHDAYILQKYTDKGEKKKEVALLRTHSGPPGLQVEQDVYLEPTRKAMSDFGRSFPSDLSMIPQELSEDSMDELLPTLADAGEAFERRNKSFNKMRTRSFGDPEAVRSIKSHKSRRTHARRRSYSDTELGSAIDFLDSFREQDEDECFSLSSMGSPRSDGSFSDGEVSSIPSSASDVVGDLNWLDVGAKIGLRLLNSEHVQRAVASQDTAERIMDISKQVERKLNKSTEVQESKRDSSFEDGRYEQFASPPRTDKGQLLFPASKPVHSMWTSPSSAAGNRSEVSVSSISDIEDASITSSAPPAAPHGRPRRQPGSSRPPGSSLPPRSPSPSTRKNELQDNIGPQKPPSIGRRRRERRSPFEPTGSTSVGYFRQKQSSLSTSKKWNRKAMLKPGVKVVVPIFPSQPGFKTRSRIRHGSSLQMATVVSSKRILVRTAGQRKTGTMAHTNCLSVTVKMDRCFLRDGNFAEMTFRVMDDWSSRHMPKHSKFPIGSCVATLFGLGVLVGWRVEDDCHVVRSLWQRRGPGSAHAYLNRDSISGMVKAAVGFSVRTTLGKGTVLAYTNGGKDFRFGRYYILVRDEGRHQGNVLEFSRDNILSCDGAQFVPIIEHLREASQYQIRVDDYEAALRKQALQGNELLASDVKLWHSWSKAFETVWSSLLKVLEEDDQFDAGMNEFVNSVISFLERLDGPAKGPVHDGNGDEGHTEEEKKDHCETETSNDPQTPGAWIVDDLFGGVFHSREHKSKDGLEESFAADRAGAVTTPDTYDRIYSVIRVLMRTVTIARAASSDQANLRLLLSVCYEFLLFVRTVVRVQQRNVSPASVRIWRQALDEIFVTFGPIKERLKKIGKGVVSRMKKHGKKAKVRILRFVDIILVDEDLLQALGRGDWNLCIRSLEDAMVKARIIDEESRENYHKTVMFIYEHLATSSKGSAQTRSSKKLVLFAKALTWIASPRRALLRLIAQDDVLTLVERVLVRVFHHQEEASRMLLIHASNFQTVRQLRMLKDFTFAGKLWIPLLDAADEELSWAVPKMTKKAQDLMRPISKLFSLCVAQFHKIGEGDLTKDWLDFLLEDKAVQLIHEIDVKLITRLESFCRDLKEIMVVLPYYPSIDDDILNLMDEVDIDEFMRDASEVIVDPDRMADFIREKSRIAIERFLDYLPKMSIPVERRDLGEGWVLTCRGEGGGDLALSDVHIEKENLTCRVLGGETLFFPMFEAETNENDSVVHSVSVISNTKSTKERTTSETSILDHIRDIILKAQRNGCWKVGIGGVHKPPTDRYVASVLRGLPISAMLDCAIELWRNLEIDDDELLEIAIRDVSYQIQMNSKQGQEGPIVASQGPSVSEGQETVPASAVSPHVALPGYQAKPSRRNRHSGKPRRRFNPRIDPTVLFLDIRKLSLNLDRFHFRIEKAERKTIFDPSFEGQGAILIRNISIHLRVECRKQRISKLGSDLTVPILHLRDFDVGLDKVIFQVKDTGADWLLNKVVKGFARDITVAVEKSLKDQIKTHVHNLMDSLNSHFVVNPDLMLGMLRITMDDLEDSYVWLE